MRSEELVISDCAADFTAVQSEMTSTTAAPPLCSWSPIHENTVGETFYLFKNDLSIPDKHYGLGLVTS